MERNIEERLCPNYGKACDGTCLLGAKGCNPEVKDCYFAYKKFYETNKDNVGSSVEDYNELVSNISRANTLIKQDVQRFTDELPDEVDIQSMKKEELKELCLKMKNYLDNFVEDIFVGFLEDNNVDY